MAGDGADGEAQADVEALEIDLEWYRAPDEPIRSETATPASSNRRRRRRATAPPFSSPASRSRYSFFGSLHGELPSLVVALAGLGQG